MSSVCNTGRRRMNKKQHEKYLVELYKLSGQDDKLKELSEKYALRMQDRNKAKSNEFMKTVFEKYPNLRGGLQSEGSGQHKYSGAIPLHEERMSVIEVNDRLPEHLRAY